MEKINFKIGQKYRFLDNTQPREGIVISIDEEEDGVTFACLEITKGTGWVLEAGKMGWNVDDNGSYRLELINQEILIGGIL